MSQQNQQSNSEGPNGFRLRVNAGTRGKRTRRNCPLDVQRLGVRHKWDRAPVQHPSFESEVQNHPLVAMRDHPTIVRFNVFVTSGSTTVTATKNDNTNGNIRMNASTFCSAPSSLSPSSASSSFAFASSSSEALSSSSSSPSFVSSQSGSLSFGLSLSTSS